MSSGQILNIARAQPVRLTACIQHMHGRTCTSQPPTAHRLQQQQSWPIGAWLQITGLVVEFLMLVMVVKLIIDTVMGQVPATVPNTGRRAPSACQEHCMVFGTRTRTIRGVHESQAHQTEDPARCSRDLVAGHFMSCHIRHM